MSRRFPNSGLVLLIAVLLGILLVAPATAHTIDYIATDIQPEAEFTGQSGHFKVIDPIAPGGNVTFMLTFELIESSGGPTTALPLTATFSVKNKGGPDNFDVTFGPAPGTATTFYTFQKNADKIEPFTTQVKAVAPSTPGSYHFKIQAEQGTLSKGLQPGEGIVIHFKVAEPDQPCNPIETVLIVDEPTCTLYKQPSIDFTATLTYNNSGTYMPLSDKQIDFSVDGVSIGSATTSTDGKATITYNPSALPVGDHTVVASYQGEECAYKPDSHSATFGVVYRFLGFQPPVQIDGVGAGLFSGKVIPVKIKIADYYGSPVPDATARVYFTQTTQALETQATAIQTVVVDTGNLMRYDATADQYILNWDISNVQNGAYNIRVAMGEGEKCAVAHWAPVMIQKSGKKSTTTLALSFPALFQIQI